MLLITVGLVLVGIVFLAIGVITQTTALLLLSIASAVIAGVTLLVQSRASRREAAPAGTGVAPAPAPSPPPTAPAPAPEPVSEPAPEPLTARLAPVGAEAGGAEARSWPSPPPPAPPAPVATVEDEEFPIADYDDLRVSEILPLLPELELDELEAVRRREEQGKNRSVIIDRIDDLIDELEAEEAEVVVTTTADDFPIEDYDALSAEQILPLLPQLDDDELDMVYEREEQGQNRAVILDAIDDMFEEEPVEPEPAIAVPPAPPAPPAKAVKTVKKVSVKKAPAKKVSAKKVSAKKVSAKKAPVKKVSVKKAPVKKVSVKKVSVKKAPVKKVSAKKGVKKVSVKKATKAGKAAKKR